MNKGKICISICAETVNELTRKIKLAEPQADFIEIRFDCLNKEEIEKVTLVQNEKFIFTFRPQEQGGNRNLTLREREIFWNSSNSFCGADFEEDIVENRVKWSFKPVICSHHDFIGIPENLPNIYERLISKNANTDVIKIAAEAKNITDTIPIWKLLQTARSENQGIIPIAMGEPGKWTRILGLAHGAFLTYASLDSGQETAPGQISAKDLVEVYRAKELDKNTEIYGIVAGNTSYSMSPYIHNAAFKFHHLNAVFVPLQIANLDEFMRRMVLENSREIELNFKGFAVTNPHKQDIIKYLDEIDETAKAIGAVNTVKIKNGKLYGFNTDAIGFIEPLKSAFGDLSKAQVAVIGNGGAARACVYALKKENAKVTIFARDVKKAEALAKEFDVTLEPIENWKLGIGTAQIVVNTTPLGTKGDLENQSPVRADELKNIRLAYDLVYNPSETAFLREAKIAKAATIGGLEMLIGQAMAQQKIWTGKDGPINEVIRVVGTRAARPQ